MASLKGLIKEYKEELLNNDAWIVFYKEKNKWNAHHVQELKGNYEDGYKIDKEELKTLKEILKIDFKAICLNKIHLEYIRENNLEDEIILSYSQRKHQLNVDFLGDLAR
jgi:hypothetical protein